MQDARIERGQVTRRRLIEASRRLFGERGYEATPIEAILAQTGVTRGALYHHFPTKQALFDAVLEEAAIEIAAASAAAARPIKDPVDSLQAGCNTWLQLSLDPAIQRITLIDAPSVVGWKRWRQLDEQHFLGGIKAGLRRLAAADHPLCADLDMVAHMLLAAVMEMAIMIAAAEDHTAALANGQDAVAGLINGLLTTPRDRRRQSES